jgi:hypothetical protein
MAHARPSVIARRLRSGTSGDRAAGPVTGPSRLTRRIRTAHSQCIAPHGRSFPENLDSLRCPEMARSAQMALPELPGLKKFQLGLGGSSRTRDRPRDRKYINPERRDECEGQGCGQTRRL